MGIVNMEINHNDYFKLYNMLLIFGVTSLLFEK